MVKEVSTLSGTRPTILDEKRRMQKELGLPQEPNIVLPRSNAPGAGRPSIGRRIAAWLGGTAP
jgi:hypothetical protein